MNWTRQFISIHSTDFSSPNHRVGEQYNPNTLAKSEHEDGLFAKNPSFCTSLPNMLSRDKNTTVTTHKSVIQLSPFSMPQPVTYREPIDGAKREVGDGLLEVICFEYALIMGDCTQCLQHVTPPSPNHTASTTQSQRAPSQPLDLARGALRTVLQRAESRTHSRTHWIKTTASRSRGKKRTRFAYGAAAQKAEPR